MPGRTPISVGDAVQAAMTVEGAPITVSARVVRRRELADGSELGLELADVSPEAQRHIEAHINRAFESL
ncbi:PilZ domain-containing protein [Actinoplanes sp. NPDC051513]|uniref:PilZ domain-containing protein n=1 Tax=Actinoplanes sp. NPDC051513 TaxID=3363908 RepID=UPI0037B0C134